jgi:hypothetical protein
MFLQVEIAFSLDQARTMFSRTQVCWSLFTYCLSQSTKREQKIGGNRAEIYAELSLRARRLPELQLSVSREFWVRQALGSRRYRRSRPVPRAWNAAVGGTWLSPGRGNDDLFFPSSQLTSDATLVGSQSLVRLEPHFFSFLMQFQTELHR